MDQQPDQPVTLHELLGRCMGELDFAHNILQSFVVTGEQQLQAIREDIHTGQQAALARKIHRLKGTTATVAARPLHHSLENLELLARTAPLEEESLLLQLENAMAEFRRVTEFVDSQVV